MWEDVPSINIGIEVGKIVWTVLTTARSVTISDSANIVSILTTMSKLMVHVIYAIILSVTVSPVLLIMLPLSTIVRSASKLTWLRCQLRFVSTVVTTWLTAPIVPPIHSVIHVLSIMFFSGPIYRVFSAATSCLIVSTAPLKLCVTYVLSTMISQQ